MKIDRYKAADVATHRVIGTSQAAGTGVYLMGGWGWGGGGGDSCILCLYARQKKLPVIHVPVQNYLKQIWLPAL